jgi:hypothetical protein
MICFLIIFSFTFQYPEKDEFTLLASVIEATVILVVLCCKSCVIEVVRVLSDHCTILFPFNFPLSINLPKKSIKQKKKKKKEYRWHDDPPQYDKYRGWNGEVV